MESQENENQEVPDEVANRPDPAEVPDADLAEPLPEEDKEEEGAGNGASGNRPDNPSEGSYPPGNPGIDEERRERAEEDLERAKPY